MIHPPGGAHVPPSKDAFSSFHSSPLSRLCNKNNVTDRGGEGRDVWIHKGLLEESWLQVGNLTVFVASVNAHKWVTDTLTYQMVGCHDSRDVRIAKSDIILCPTSRRYCLTKVEGLDQVAARQMFGSSMPQCKAVDVANGLVGWAFKCSGGVLPEHSQANEIVWTIQWETVWVDAGAPLWGPWKHRKSLGDFLNAFVLLV